MDTLDLVRDNAASAKANDTEAGDHSMIGEVVDAWTDELSHRLQQVRDGSVELVDVDEVKARMQKRRAARRPDEA